MVPAADLPRDPDQRLILILPQAVQHRHTQHGMLVQSLLFLGGQRPGLAQEAAAHRDLADVVQGRCGGDEGAFLGRDGVTVGDLDQPFQQDPGQDLHPLDVLAVLAIVRSRHLTEDADHDLVVFLPLVELLRHHGAQLPLLGEEADGVGYPPLHHPRIEGAADVIHCPQLVGTVGHGVGVLAGDHDDRDLFQQAVAVHPRQHLKPVHVRHHDVQQHQCDLAAVEFQLPHTLRAAGCLYDLEIFDQDRPQDLAVHRRIVHHQHHGLGRFGRGLVEQAGVVGDDGVFPPLGLIHPPVGLPHSLFHRDARRQHPADAGRKPDPLVAGHDGHVQIFVDDRQLADKLIPGDVGQHQQQLIAAVPHQKIRAPDVFLDDGSHGLQHLVAGLMAVGVVAELEIVQIDHGNARRQELVAQVVLIIAAVVRAGQRVGIDPPVGDELPVQAAVHGLHHLDHAGHAVHFHIPRSGIVHPSVGRFQLVFLALVDQRFPADAAGAGVLVLPWGRARLLFQRFFGQEPHHIVHLAVTGHFFLRLLMGQLDRILVGHGDAPLLLDDPQQRRQHRQEQEHVSRLFPGGSSVCCFIVLC